MQITVEKVVWIALVLVVVAVVGLFLMGQVLTGAQQTGQKFFVRLISSNYVEGEGYVITFRIVNSGEAGNSIFAINVTTVGFENVNAIEALSPVSDNNLADGIAITIGPKEAVDITIRVSSDYAHGSKSLIISADFDNDITDWEASQTIEIP